jgi:hypothetical protein
MRATNPSLGVRPEAFQFADLTTSGPFARLASRSPFSHSEERTLASQLLEVASEAELEQVLQDLSIKARRGVEPVAPTSARPLEGLLKTVAKKALPSLATAVGAYSDRPGRDTKAEKLGSLLDQALRAKTGGMSFADPDLKQYRQLFERYRQFVRLAGKATKAAAAAPPGVAPVAVAHKILGDSASKALTRTPTAAPTKAPTPGSAPRRGTSMAPEAVGSACSICESPAGSCGCRKIGRTGGWFRDGTSIVVNC